MDNYRYSTNGELMRGITQVVIPSNRIRVLEETFPHSHGKLGELEDGNTLQFYTTQSMDKLLGMVRGLGDLMKARGIDAGDLFSKSYYGPEGHRVKSTRIIRGLVKDMGYDLSPCSTSNKQFEKWLVDHSALFRAGGMGYEVRWDIDAFDMLGNLPYVDDYDAGKSSCYDPEGGLFFDAPVALADGFGKNANTFVVLLHRDANGDREYIARCWGIVRKPYILISNGYYANEGVDRSMHTFMRVLRVATGKDLRGIGDPMYADKHYLPVYVNEDTYLCWEHEEVGAPSRTDSTLFYYKNENECVSCGNFHMHVDHEFVHAYCNGCTGNGEDPCGVCQCGDPVYEETAEYCDKCCSYYCRDCFYEDHEHCSDCCQTVCFNKHAFVTIVNWARSEQFYHEDCIEQGTFVECEVCHDNHFPDDVPTACKEKKEN